MRVARSMSEGRPLKPVWQHTAQINDRRLDLIAESGNRTRLTDRPDDSSNIVEATASNAQRYGSSDGNGSWYYFDSNGKPKYLKADATSMSKATVRINGQSYFFDEYGKMQYGLIGIDFGDGTEHSAYFGNSESDGKMRTDKQTSVTEDSGTR